MRIYSYQKCSTCRNALKWLEEKGIEFEVREIKETRPTLAELQTMMTAKDGEVKKLFNTSGMDYRAMGLKEKLPTLSTDEALALLRENGMLVKRPFLIGEGVALNGFREKEWAQAFSS